MSWCVSSAAIASRAYDGVNVLPYATGNLLRGNFINSGFDLPSRPVCPGGEPYEMRAGVTGRKRADRSCRRNWMVRPYGSGAEEGLDFGRVIEFGTIDENVRRNHGGVHTPLTAARNDRSGSFCEIREIRAAKDAGCRRAAYVQNRDGRSFPVGIRTENNRPRDGHEGQREDNQKKKRDGTHENRFRNSNPRSHITTDGRKFRVRYWISPKACRGPSRMNLS